MACSVERRKAHNATYYARHKNEHIERVRKNKQLARLVAKTIIEAAKDRPCMDCGVHYPPYVMDFDHRDPKTKTFGIASGKTYTSTRLQQEILKCDVVCANCHRERTHGRKRLSPPSDNG